MSQKRAGTIVHHRVMTGCDALCDLGRYLWEPAARRDRDVATHGDIRTKDLIGPRRLRQQDAGEIPDMDDDELVAHAQRDATRFDALYAKYEQQIFAFIRSRVEGDRAHIEDLTSRVFAKALAGLPAFRAGSFRGWLYRIARNVVIDDLRGHHPMVPIDDMTALEDPADRVDDRVIQRMLQLTLRRALEILPASQRTVIELRLHGLTARQIGEQLGLHTEAVKSAQYRAFEKLLNHFNETGQIRREDL